MFTGIVEEVGTIAEIEKLGSGLELRIAADRVLEGVELGASIAVDGVCQTVTAFDGSSFSMQAVATTLERTTFGDLIAGRRVNLERALAVGDRLGGHMVQGHVDAVGEVLDVVPRGEHTIVEVAVPPEIDVVTIPHGSITVDGVSLTVNALPRPGVVQLSIIPFTMEHTTMNEYRPGRRVNLEGDLIGKYVRRLLGAPGAAAADPLKAWGYQ